MVKADDILSVLKREYPKVKITVVGAWDSFTFKGDNWQSCRDRAADLMKRAQLFNAHLDCGHVKNKRNWWNRV